ncbi:hypothetical protein [Methyloglobulus sp.]|uniref:hypothetical protein n=1 Tax=Methyloglobulus sp. TaxID=2518622 RepID=UPI003988B165
MSGDIHLANEVFVGFRVRFSFRSTPERNDSDKSSAAGDDPLDPITGAEPLLVFGIADQAEALIC